MAWSQAGLRGWRRQVSAMVFVTGAYYLTNLYGRGAWGEFVATSALPLVVAAGVWLIRARQWRAAPVLGFAVSVATLSGAHNITLLWGGLFVAALAIVALVALPRHGRELSWRRVAAVVGVGALSVCANAWFLGPDVAYVGKTLIRGQDSVAAAFPSSTRSP